VEGVTGNRRNKAGIFEFDCLLVRRMTVAGLQLLICATNVFMYMLPLYVLPLFDVLVTLLKMEFARFERNFSDKSTRKKVHTVKTRHLFWGIADLL